MCEKEKIENVVNVSMDALEAGVEAGVGTMIGGVIAGPAGAIGGAVLGNVVGKVIKRIADDVKERFLSKKEGERIDNVLIITKQKIEENLNEGKNIRTDTFFEEKSDNRSSAEELLEGVLLIAQKEYEEKKIKLLATLYANVVFDNTISSSTINRLIRIFSDLTYRQIMIIKLIGDVQLRLERMPNPLYKESFGEIKGYDNISIASDIFDLYSKSIIMSSSVIFDVAGINPSNLKLAGDGALLYNLVELSILEIDEIYKDIFKFLSNLK